MKNKLLYTSLYALMIGGTLALSVSSPVVAKSFSGSSDIYVDDSLEENENFKNKVMWSNAVEEDTHYLWETVYDDPLRVMSAQAEAIEAAAPAVQGVITDTRKPIELNLGSWNTRLSNLSPETKSIFSKYDDLFKQLESGLDVLSPAFQGFLQNLPKDKQVLSDHLERVKQSQLDYLCNGVDLTADQKERIRQTFEKCKWSSSCIGSILSSFLGSMPATLDMALGKVEGIQNDLAKFDEMIADSNQFSRDTLVSAIAERVTERELSSLLGDAMTVDYLQQNLQGKSQEEVKQYFYNQAFSQMATKPQEMQNAWDRVYSKAGLKDVPVDLGKYAHKDFAATVIAQVATENYFKNKK